MLVEAVAAGKTVAEATELAAAQLGVPVSAVQTEILEEPKRSLLGKIKGEARVRVFYEKEEQTKIQIAKEYINTILTAMGLSGFTITESGDEDHAVLNIEGEGLGVIIGRRGETLDAIQYLASLAANRLGGDYFRITVDSGDYRSKREKTLIHLAEKLSKTVLRTGRSSALEPMNPYERRIIHSVVSGIEGVVSKSVGEEPNRKVVISSTNPRRQDSRRPRGGNDRNDRRRYDSRRRDEDVPLKSMNLSKVGQTSYEAEYIKAEKTEREKKAKLYEKIEL